MKAAAGPANAGGPDPAGPRRHVGPLPRRCEPIHIAIDASVNHLYDHGSQGGTRARTFDAPGQLRALPRGSIDMEQPVPWDVNMSAQVPAMFYRSKPVQEAGQSDRT